MHQDSGATMLGFLCPSGTRATVGIKHWAEAMCCAGAKVQMRDSPEDLPLGLLVRVQHVFLGGRDWFVL